MAASQSDLRRRLQVLMNRKENQVCADCPEKSPRWASLIKLPGDMGIGKLQQIGAFMCLECSGSHRRLGVHIAFVRSINLDQWKENEVLAMENGGNAKVNAIFEARLHNGVKIQSGANGATRERYIRDKYERRKYYDRNALPSSDEDEEESESEDEPESTPSPTVSRAAAAARMRTQTKIKVSQRMKKPPIKIPKSVPVAKPAPEVDLLDFGSFVSATPTEDSTPAPPSHPGTPQQTNSSTNNVGDLFGGMTISPMKKTVNARQNKNTQPDSVLSKNQEESWTSAFITPPSKSSESNNQQNAHKSNADIMAMFNTPSQAHPQMMMMQNQQVNNMGNYMNQQPQFSQTTVHGSHTIGVQQHPNQMQLNPQMMMNMQSMPSQQQIAMQHQMQLMYQQQMMMNAQQPNERTMSSMNFSNGQIPTQFDAQMKQQEKVMMMQQNQRDKQNQYFFQNSFGQSNSGI